MAAFATVARKGKFTTKILVFRAGILHITDADIGSLKSLHTLLDKYLDHMLLKFKQNCLVRNIQNFELLVRKIWLTIFEKVWKMFLL